MSDEPSKFILINNVKKLNPEWKKWKATHKQAGIQSMSNQDTALAVITDTNHCGTAVAQNDDNTNNNNVVQVTDNVTAAIDEYKTAKASQVGLDGVNAYDELARVFGKYEIPMGMLKKLYLLSEFDKIEYNLDDSYSMDAGNSETTAVYGRTLTRFEEMKERIKMMFELFAFVPTPPIEIHWMNNTTVTTIERQQGETPQNFITRANQQLDQAFSRGTCGGTPALQMLQKSFENNKGKSVIRYFFGDGQPAGGATACRQIEELLMKRENPERNPFTFMSCTDEDEATEWMKTAEERAPVCGEYDDFGDESDEVLGDQGAAFPFSQGLYLVGLCVGAMDPVLDNLDECSPLTKATMEDLLGYRMSIEEYRYYFDHFMIAQNKKVPRENEDYFKYHYAHKFAEHREEFETAAIATDIQVVKDYKANLPKANSMGRELKTEVERKQRAERERLQRIERADRAVRQLPLDEQGSRGSIEYEQETARVAIEKLFKKNDPRNGGCGCDKGTLTFSPVS